MVSLISLLTPFPPQHSRKVIDYRNAPPDARLEARLALRPQHDQSVRERPARGGAQFSAQGGRGASAGEAECEQACRGWAEGRGRDGCRRTRRFE